MGVTVILLPVAIAAVFSIVIATWPAAHRERYLPLIALLAAGAYYQEATLAFLAVSAVAYLIVCWLSVQTSRSRRWRLACIALILLATLFTTGRVLGWQELTVRMGPTHLAVYHLDMWLTLRLVTLFWEVGSGTVPVLSLSRYIAWICLPFTLAGPLLRYSQWPKVLSPDRSFLACRSWWFALGASILQLVIGSALPILQTAVVARWPKASLAHAALAALMTGPIGFYLLTAGQFQLMEVLGRPAGFKIPESFNYPIGRENISLFWMNWNMTATAVFRDYLFYNRWGRQNYNVYFNSLLLFTLVGLWHAANLYWILWGLLHGALFCGYLLWRKHANKFRLPLRGTPAARVGASVLTYLCVCACWYLPSKILQKAGYF